MSLSGLNDDLLKDFKEQKEMIYQQIELFDPLGTRLRQPGAVRLVSKSALIVTEIICYLLSLGSIVFAIVLHAVFPLYLVAGINTQTRYENISLEDIEFLNLTLYGLIGIITILTYVIARCMRQIRLKNDILHFAGKQMKELVAQHLRRKASIEIIEQRHFVELPPLPYEVNDVNKVPNPGYGN